MMEEIEDPVVRELFKHLNAQSLNDRMEEFFKNNCFEFHNGCDWTEADEQGMFCADEGEQSLENFALYKDYCGLIEDSLQEFCSKENLTQAQVFKRCQSASKESPFTEALLQMLLSASEYQLFALQMHLTWMAEKNTEETEEGKSGDGGDDDEHSSESKHK